MSNKDSLYYYIDIDLRNLRVLKWGATPHATLTGDTDDSNVHRVFLTKGQYNKLKKRLE